MSLVPLSPGQQLAVNGLPVAPSSGPTRFPFGGQGIHHEYQYVVNGVTVWIHVHRNNNGQATQAHAKPNHLRYATGTVLTGAADTIMLGTLGSYGILNPDAT